MSLSHANLAIPHEQYTPIEHIASEDLRYLIDCIRNHASKAGNQKTKIDLLSLELGLLLERQPAPSAERSIKVHTALMKVFLVDGFIEQNKTISTSNPSIKTSLCAAVADFKKKTKSRFFLGDIPHGTKEKDFIETQIMHSICSQREASEIVDIAYQRVRQAIVDSLHDDRKKSQLQTLYQNARQAIMEIEDKAQTSSARWNAHLNLDGLSTVSSLNISLGERLTARQTPLSQESKETTRQKLIQAFYPNVLLALLKERPADGKVPFNQHEISLLNTLHDAINRIIETNTPLQGNEDKIKLEIYQTMMRAYLDAYIHENKKEGRTQIKGPLLKHYENTLKKFHDKTKLNLFYGEGNKIHDRILNTLQSSNNESAQFAKGKNHLRNELVKYTFYAAITEGLNGKTDASQNHFIYAYKATHKMGQEARLKLNEYAAELLQEPDLLLINGSAPQHHADLQALFKKAKTSTEIMSTVQYINPPPSPSDDESRYESKYDSQNERSRLGFFAKPGASTVTTASNSRASTAPNSRRPSLENNETPAPDAAHKHRLKK